MNIIIKIPCRGRPEKFKQTFLEYQNKLSNQHNVNFICSFDHDDPLMNSNDIKEFLSQFNNTKYFYGYNKNKIEAINADIGDAIFDILIQGSDDMTPIYQNYDDIICVDMMKHFPDLDGSLHYYNPMWAERLDVNYIVGYNFYKKFNYIYHPSYKSIHCDNEFTEVKNSLNKNYFFSCGKSMFIHSFITNDDTANKNWQYNHEDYQNYEYRKGKNFDL